MNIHLTHIFLASLMVMPLAAQTPPTAAGGAAPAATPSPDKSAPATHDPAGPLATAVLNFQSSNEETEKQGADTAALLEADLSVTDHAVMVERQDLNKILGEQELGASGVVSPDTAAKIGSLTGAQVLVSGRMFTVGTQYMLVAKIISTETSRVYGVTSTVSSLSSLPQGVQDLSGKIDAVLASHRDVLAAVQETPEQRLERLRAIVGKRDLPTVSVVINEHDYTQETIDPAAQTELTLLLQQLGFQVIEPDQTHKTADIAITGEAFSELGAFHGNLISARARIEIKIVGGTSQQLIAADRETQIAVATGARTAGKDALQKAADKIIERILPKLTK
jgi:hypothetical protein